jgi:hypothetical protein
MNVNTSRTEQDPAAIAPEEQMLNEVYRRLVRIHSAVVERTNADSTIVPWTERELWELLQDLGTFRRERREASESALRK